jgi:hypothetical protein
VVRVICEALGKDPRDVLAKIVFYDPAALNLGCNKLSCEYISSSLNCGMHLKYMRR